MSVVRRQHGPQLASLSNFVRREESDRALTCLHDDIGAWLELRHAADELDQYCSQLDAIERQLDAAVTDLRRGIRGIDVELDATSVHEGCRLADFRTLWLRRVWQFFREKFDQRDDPRAHATLAAADEIVWSCYHAVFEQARHHIADVVEQPAPLPFFESRYAPEAQPSELVPLDLKEDLGFVHAHLERMPLAVVRIPPTCIAAPWWLTLLAHEVGHHVQTDLLPGRALERSFANRIGEAGGRTGDAARWSDWSAEVFADVFSVCAIGPPAITAMAHLQFRDRAAMVKPRKRYPPAVIRLAIMIAAGEQLNLGAPRLPPELDLTSLTTCDDGIRQARATVPAVAQAALEPLPDLPVGLAQLCSVRSRDFLFGGFVPDRAAWLRDPQGDGASRSLRAPRMVSSASMLAWTDIAQIDDADRRGTERADLARDTPGAIRACRESGTREGASAVTTDAAPGHGLAEALLNADPTSLEAL